MQYNSTRNKKLTATSIGAVLRGIAPDSGLYMTEPPGFSPERCREVLAMDFDGMAEELLGALLPDYPGEELRRMVHAAYDGRFAAPEVTPLVSVGERHILELFHGPTAAFKDVALSLLPHLITGAKRLTGDTTRTVILTATSGDTGKAALAGFCDVEGTSIIVFYPNEGVSAIQKLQMVTQPGGNVAVCAVEGNFDDAQTGVKHIFSEMPPQNGAALSSANSINIGRLAPQVVYYWHAYAALLHSGRIAMGDKVNFVVPTGNFGNILAGYLAKRMGLPIGKLVCASNQNDVLTDFLQTGRYDRNRPFYKTASPSMDILVSSNLERLLYLVSDEDVEMVAEKMRELNEKGCYQIEENLLQKIKEDFLCGCCDDAATARTIRKVWEAEHYLCDPHTAVAWNVCEQCKEQLSGETVVLSTASPYKFAPAVLQALGEEVPADSFDAMKKLSALTGTAIPVPLAALRELPIRHRDCIPREEMLRYVSRKMEETVWNR